MCLLQVTVCRLRKVTVEGSKNLPIGHVEGGGGGGRGRGCEGELRQRKVQLGKWSVSSPLIRRAKPLYSLLFLYFAVHDLQLKFASEWIAADHTQTLLPVTLTWGDRHQVALRVESCMQTTTQTLRNLHYKYSCCCAEKTVIEKEWGLLVCPLPYYNLFD